MLRPCVPTLLGPQKQHSFNTAAPGQRKKGKKKGKGRAARSSGSLQSWGAARGHTEAAFVICREAIKAPNQAWKQKTVPKPTRRLSCDQRDLLTTDSSSLAGESRRAGGKANRAAKQLKRHERFGQGSSPSLPPSLPASLAASADVCTGRAQSSRTQEF